MKTILSISIMLILCASLAVDAQTVLTGTLTNGNTQNIAEDECFILRNAYLVESGATLNIAAGALGLAETDAILVVAPGGVVNISGTANKPVVFTSDQGGSSAPGDWTGLRFAGDAPTNDGPIPLPNTMATAGGSNPTHGLVNIDYLEIHYAGAADALGETFGLSLLALGTGCAINNVLVTNSAGSGYALWGGAPEVKGVMNVNSAIHGYVFSFGNTSKVQNIADIRNDASIVYPSGAASFLVWNNDNVGNNFDNLNPGDPYTDPLISNYTALHPNFCDEQATNSLDGIRFEQNGRAKFRNGVIGGVGSGSAGIFINGEQCIALTASGDIIVDYTDFLGNTTNADYDFVTDDWFTVPGCSDDIQQWIGEASGGGACAMANNIFDPSLPNYDESICFTCPLEDPVEFVVTGGSHIEDADFIWVSMGDMFFDQTLELRGAFQDENVIYDWVNVCPEGITCPEQKPMGNLDKIADANHDIRVYPNPAQRELSVQVTGYTGELSAVLVDLTGRQLISTTVKGNGTTVIPVHQLPTGTYFMQLSFNGVMQQVMKIAKY